MVKAVFDELARRPAEEPLHRRHQRRRHPHQPRRRSGLLDSKPPRPCALLFFGLGADGTVGANKNSIKIIGEDTDNLRPGLLRLRLEEVRRHDHLPPALRPEPIRSSYLITKANFVACHQFVFLERYRRARIRRAGRHLPVEQPLSARTKSGTSCRARSSSRSSTRSSSST